MNEKLRILVVEDNPADADLIQELLSETTAGPVHFQAEPATRLSKAITRLERKDIDLVLLDLSLPDSHGLETFHDLRKAAPDVPMILLTGNNNQELAVAAVRDGAQDFLVKGQISGPLLVRSIQYALERKQAEWRLQMFQFATDQADDAVFWMDRHAGFYYVNNQACHSLGYTREELMQLRLFDIDPTYPEERWKANWAQFHEKRIEVERLEGFHRRKDGVVFPIEVVGKHCWFGDTELHVAYVRNITERKQAEERLHKQAALLDAANDGIYVRALDHTVTYWNDGAERLYDWTRAETLGRKIPDLGNLGHEAYAAAHAMLLEQGRWSGELKKKIKAGKEIVVFCRWTLLRDEQGRPKEVLAISTDITEQKKLEANFLRAQRMEGIGALAGGIAHDLNNILQPILMTAPLLRETTSDPESRELLDTVESCARRGADIIRQLLTFARGELSARVSLPVRHLVTEMGKLIQETFPKNIQLCVNVPKDLWLALGDATQIHQALMNLCVNARDAMPNGGTLTLVAENQILDEAFAAMMPGAKPGPHICVRVTDTGTGILPEHLDRIFDPFFTTKEVGKGTGLGLATVLGIARGHGGFVRVNSQAGKGTIFELYFPASPEPKAAVSSERETLPPRADGELILVVDDEADVRSVVRRALEKHGYRVVTAAEGAEAVVVFDRYRDEVRAVLTDMMMPVVDGPSLILALRQLEPQLPILGMTGVGEKADLKKLEALGLLALLTKPFNSAGMLGILHQALAAAHKAMDKP